MALVNKRWAELCNRIIWSRIRQLKALEGLLPTSWFSINSIYPMKLCKRHKFRVSSNGEGYADCRVCSKIKDSQQQWENFLQHTSWIQTFVYNAPLGSCNAPLKRFMNFSKIFSAGIMMPNLRFVKLILGHSKEALQGAVYFLAETPSLKTLTVSTHCRNQQLLSRLIDTIARRCEQLEYINLTIPDAVSAEAIEEGDVLFFEVDGYKNYGIFALFLISQSL
ncbi:hypothetical protein ABKN59_008979 [Abortiporus biennis]